MCKLVTTIFHIQKLIVDWYNFEMWASTLAELQVSDVTGEKYKAVGNFVEVPLRVEDVAVRK